MSKLEAIMNRHYDERSALSYDNNPFWREYLVNTYNLAIKLMQPEKDDIILDAPIGTGRLSEILIDYLNENGKIYGVDISKTMLNIARKRLKKYSNVFISECDITELPYKDDLFDKIFSLNALHYLKNPNFFIRECYRTLKSNGSLILIDFDRTYLSMKLGEFIFRLNPAHVRSYKIREAKDLLAQNGFVVEEALSEKPGLFWGYYGLLAVKNN